MPRTPVQAVAFLLGLWIALWLSPFGASASADPELTRLEADLYDQVNAVRIERHLMPLSRSRALDAVARGHSLDMVNRSYVAHESPEGANAMHRLERARVEGFSLAAENIGATNRAGPNREIVSSWLASPIHRTNLLAPAFNATGIGIARASDGTLIYTQLYVTYPR
jgi:uncharacterized protein YkwD